MILGRDRKKDGGLAITLIASKGAEDEPSDDYMGMLDGASEEILSAVKKNDAKAFTLGLKNFISICKEYGDMDGGEDSEDGEEEKEAY